MHTKDSAKTLFNEIINQLTIANKNKNISAYEARTMAFWLLEYYLELSWTAILMDKSVNITPEVREKMNDSVQRIINNEPVQYVLGFMEFYGRRFAVNPDVLIPRRETEELVSLITRENKYLDDLAVLDLGTGSGCIAVSLGAELNRARVTGIDNNEAALNLARKNAGNFGIEGYWLQGDILNSEHFDALIQKLIIQENEGFDIIVSNPPYVRNKEKQEMAQNVLAHEPGEALFVPDEDPLLFYRKIMEIIQQYADSHGVLKKGGQVYFEVNEAFGEDVGKLIAANGFGDIKIYQDMQGKDRVVYGIFNP